MTTHVASTSLASLSVHLRKLVVWTPSRPVVARVGELYLTRKAHARMMPANDGHDPLRTTAGAAFDQFVEGGAAAHRLFDDSWGRLGVAQLKVMSPDPGTRLIGGFINPQLFVGLRVYWRDELDFKATGQRGLIDYRTLGQEAAADWDALLPDVRRKPMKEFANE